MSRLRSAPRTTTLASLALLALLAASAAAQAFEFEEAATAAGLDFRHATSEDIYNYLEVTGGGLCWGDVDLDGVDDLFLTNGLYSNDTHQAALDPRSALYLNDGDGTFTDASAAWGADASGWVQSCSLADYDGDGDLDLALNGYDLLRLLRNDRPGFTDVSEAAGLTTEEKCGEGVFCFGSSTSWADYDEDGDLDLLVTNYVDWDIREGGLASPGLYNGQPEVLWRNNGDGTFTDVTEAAGVRDAPGPNHSKTFQAIWADYDRDGDVDAYLTSDTTVNSFFRNNGDGTFSDVAASTGTADPRASMGLVFQDIDSDERPDLYMTHYQLENNGFYVNEADGTFLDRSGEGDLGDDFQSVGWGTGFFDFDQDGDLDIYAVNGHTGTIEVEHDQKPLLWSQNEDGTFDDVSDAAGPTFATRSVSRGSAVADYDLDGDLDIAILASFNETARLARNDEATGNWLQVELREPSGMNRFAIGAEVRITPADRSPILRTLQASTSFLSQDSLVAHAGLGSAATADVLVRWTDGSSQSFSGLAANQRVRITKGSTDVLQDTLAPFTTIRAEGVGGDGAYRSDITVSVDAVDRAMGPPSGVAGSEIRVDGGAWGPYGGPVTLTGEGAHTVQARSTDAAGNAEPARSRTLFIDLTPPATAATILGTPGDDGWRAGGAGVVFAAADNLAGVAEIRARVDGGDWTTAGFVEVSGSGVHLVEYQAEDRAGNVEVLRALEVKTDSDSPTVHAEPKPLAAGLGAAEVGADAADGTSGVRRVSFFVGAEETPRFVDTDGTDGWTWVLTDLGAHVVRVEAADAVGHTDTDATTVLVGPEPPPLPPFGLVLPALLPAVLGRRRA